MNNTKITKAKVANSRCIINVNTCETQYSLCSMDHINFFKTSKYYIYFVKFKSRIFTRVLFKIGITTNLDKRLQSLKHEYHIESDYELLLAVQVNSPQLEKDIIRTFNCKFPHLTKFIKIGNVHKNECMLFDDELLHAIDDLFDVYRQQLNLDHRTRQCIKVSSSDRSSDFTFL